MGRKKNKPTKIVYDSEKEWEVEQIVNKRITKAGKTEYQVKWKDYPAADNTWEPAENLGCHVLISNYEKNQEKNNNKNQEKKEDKKEATKVADKEIKQEPTEEKEVVSEPPPKKDKKTDDANPAEKAGDGNNDNDDEDDDDEDEWEVEKIVSKKIIRGKVLYFVKWKDWPDSDNTWEPVDNLESCPELVSQYEESIKPKTTPKKKGRPIKVKWRSSVDPSASSKTGENDDGDVQSASQKNVSKAKDDGSVASTKKEEPAAAKKKKEELEAKKKKEELEAKKKKEELEAKKKKEELEAKKNKEELEAKKKKEEIEAKKRDEELEAKKKKELEAKKKKEELEAKKKKEELEAEKKKKEELEAKKKKELEATKKKEEIEEKKKEEVATAQKQDEPRRGSRRSIGKKQKLDGEKEAEGMTSPKKQKAQIIAKDKSLEQAMEVDKPKEVVKEGAKSNLSTPKQSPRVEAQSPLLSSPAKFSSIEDKKYTSDEIEKIVDKKIVRGKARYLVKWKEEQSKANAWILKEMLQCDELIVAYEGHVPTGKRSSRIPKPKVFKEYETDLPILISKPVTVKKAQVATKHVDSVPSTAKASEKKNALGPGKKRKAEESATPDSDNSQTIKKKRKVEDAPKPEKKIQVVEKEKVKEPETSESGSKPAKEPEVINEPMEMDFADFAEEQLSKEKEPIDHKSQKVTESKKQGGKVELTRKDKTENTPLDIGASKPQSENAKDEDEEPLIKMISSAKMKKPESVKANVTKKKNLEMAIKKTYDAVSQNQSRKANADLANWMKGVKVEKIINATKFSGILKLLVKYNGSEKQEYVRSTLVGEKYPQMVIKFYQSLLKVERK